MCTQESIRHNSVSRRTGGEYNKSPPQRQGCWESKHLPPHLEHRKHFLNRGNDKGAVSHFLPWPGCDMAGFKCGLSPQSTGGELATSECSVKPAIKPLCFYHRCSSHFMSSQAYGSMSSVTYRCLSDGCDLHCYYHLKTLREDFQGFYCCLLKLS